MSEYHIIVVKMVPKFVNNNCTKVNFELLYDIKVLFELAILLPLLEEVNNNLMKLAKAWEIFVVNYVVAIKFCYTYLFLKFENPNIAFKFDLFIFSSFWWIPPMTSLH
jgi:hypothetical protein